jgi:Flp pilus assembly CpaE family ATPase
MNRANARVHLDISDVERALGVAAEFKIPSDIAIPQAVNRGVPVVLDKPRAPAAIALRALAERYSSSEPGPAVATPEVPAEPTRKRGWRR